jgi:hypothetical protein
MRNFLHILLFSILYLSGIGKAMAVPPACSPSVINNAPSTVLTDTPFAIEVPIVHPAVRTRVTWQPKGTVKFWVNPRNNRTGKFETAGRVEIVASEIAADGTTVCRSTSLVTGTAPTLIATASLLPQHQVIALTNTGVSRLGGIPDRICFGSACGSTGGFRAAVIPMPPTGADTVSGRWSAIMADGKETVLSPALVARQNGLPWTVEPDGLTVTYQVSAPTLPNVSSMEFSGDTLTITFGFRNDKIRGFTTVGKGPMDFAFSDLLDIRVGLDPDKWDDAALKPAALDQRQAKFSGIAPGSLGTVFVKVKGADDGQPIVLWSMNGASATDGWTRNNVVLRSGLLQFGQ